MNSLTSPYRIPEEDRTIRHYKFSDATRVLGIRFDQTLCVLQAIAKEIAKVNKSQGTRNILSKVKHYSSTGKLGGVLQ